MCRNMFISDVNRSIVLTGLACKDTLARPVKFSNPVRIGSTYK